ncbi:FIST C-terminal domain-containing protein [Colwellia sp. MB02u-10]|uniref:nitric oxide-sensing protein NosP n=1 Tax=Colwellia sp. MB02u-10 TaxID=2759828 RepID=UPI0015F3E490|nr:nitric oxide-sensing protein NosP [Colwellia sp. MB02u-10]MBA6340330.1 FIST C-terminal domain-containing protein [Colwellia sp. MB02u-10]
MTNIKTIVAVSKSIDPLKASQEIQQQLNHPDIDFVLFYCSAVYQLDELAAAMTLCLKGIDIVGCTTAGEFTRDGSEQKSIVAIGFSGKYFSISAIQIESMEDFTVVDAQNTMSELAAQCCLNELAPIQDNSFLVTLLDGLSRKEELFLQTLNSATYGIPHFGGSAGDDVNLANTHVFYQNKFYQQAAVVILINTKCAFEVFNCNHIKCPTEKLVVTEADVENRTVYELNAMPAAVEYANLLNIDVKDLTPEVFSLNPLAVKVGGQYYIRSIQKVNVEDLSLTFYCAIDVGIVLAAVEMDNICDSLNNKLENITQRLGKSELVLAFDCFLRRIEIEQKELNKAIESLYAKYNIAGFNSYGEHINGIHLNQTFAAVFIAENETKEDNVNE